MSVSRSEKTHRSKPGKPPKGPVGRWRSFPLHHLVAMGLIAGVALAAYANTFNVPFHFDDLPNIAENPLIQIKVLTWEALARLIQHTYKATIRIFSMLTFAL